MPGGGSTEPEMRNVYNHAAPAESEHYSKVPPATAASTDPPTPRFQFGLLTESLRSTLLFPKEEYVRSATFSRSHVARWATLISEGRPPAELEDPQNKEPWLQGWLPVAPSQRPRPSGSGSAQAWAEHGLQGPVFLRKATGTGGSRGRDGGAGEAGSTELCPQTGTQDVVT